MALVMYTTTGPEECCDTSHVVSLDTLHGADGLVDTIPDTSGIPNPFTAARNYIRLWTTVVSLRMRTECVIQIPGPLHQWYV